MKKIFVIIIALILLVWAGFRLKSNHDALNSKKQVGGNASLVVSVNTASVSSMRNDQTLNLVGTLNPYRETNIASEISGKITYLNCEEGQFKGQGATIAVVDDKLKSLGVRSAQIALNKAKKDLIRYKNLYKGGGATEQQLDDMQNTFYNAEVQLDEAKKQLKDATIKAPIPGTITQKLIERGAFVNVGTSIASIVDISRLKVKINVSETNVYNLKIGDHTVITTSVYPGVAFEGRISFINPQGDDAHNYIVEVVINNNSVHKLKAGTFVNVNIHIPAKGNSLFIPRESLIGSTEDAQVYVAENGKAILRNITIGAQTDAFLEVLSGLSQGEKVIITGQVNLSEGKAIRIVNNK